MKSKLVPLLAVTVGSIMVIPFDGWLVESLGMATVLMGVSSLAARKVVFRG